MILFSKKLKKDGFALKFASNELRNNKNIIIRALKYDECCDLNNWEIYFTS